MNKSYLIIGLVILLGLGGVGYYAMTKGQQLPVENSMENQPAVPTESSMQPEDFGAPSKTTNEAMTTEVNEVMVEAGSFYYKPNTITVKRGEKVKIVMNSVSMMHDFVIDELNVKMPVVKDGDTGMVEFTADKVGTFEYYCSVGQHRANGQVGTLTVTE